MPNGQSYWVTEAFHRHNHKVPIFILPREIWMHKARLTRPHAAATLTNVVVLFDLSGCLAFRSGCLPVDAILVPTAKRFGHQQL